jgi:hypothetical protein
MPLAQLPTAMMQPKTVKVTSPINSAYSIREAPRSSRQILLSKIFYPHGPIEVQGNTRDCPSGATQGIKTLCGSQLRSTSSAQCIGSVMLLTKVLECAHARSRMLAKC